MFTDIKGFSAMMGEDEERTVRLVEGHRTLVRNCIPQFDGLEHGTIGDAFVVLFESAVQAVQCAAEIQRRLAQENQGRPPQEQVWIRIGIHLGDVLSNNKGDIYGDAVNIAARAEPLAPAGGICVTDSVYSQCRNKVPLQFLAGGTASMKNIKDPPGIFTYHPDQVPPEAEIPAVQAPVLPAPRSKPKWPVFAVAGVALAALATALVMWVLPPNANVIPKKETSAAEAPTQAPTAPAQNADGAPSQPNGPAEATQKAPPSAENPSPQVTPVFSANPTAEKRYQTAYEAFMAGHLTTAEQEFKAAISVDPESALGQLLLAYTYQSTDRETMFYRTIETVYTLVTDQTRGKDLRTLGPELQLVMTCAGGLYAATPDVISDLFVGISEDYPKLMLGRLLWGLTMMQGGRCDLPCARSRRPSNEIRPLPWLLSARPCATLFWARMPRPSRC